ncbi:MAG TPA: hypothetical protein VEL28_09970 [Candidatus Binatia bacterium]|nr:hypothetical protein [Candidatus Binatia bacterium]
MHHPAIAILAALIVSFDATPASAEPFSVHRDGPQFVVNETLPGEVSVPDIAAAGPGRAIVVWQASASDHLLSSENWSRRITRGEGTGPQQLLNPGNAYLAAPPRIDGDETAGFVTVWSVDLDLGNEISADVFGRWLDGSGKPSGESEIAIPARHHGFQSRPQVAVGADGTAFVVWADGYEADAQLRGRFFGSDGGAVTRDRTVMRRHGLAQSAVQPLSGGRFVALWDSFAGLQLRNVLDYYDADGTHARRVELHDRLPAARDLAACADGRHLILRSENVGHFEPQQTMGQWFDADGTMNGEPFLITSEAPGYLAMTVTPDCHVLIVTPTNTGFAIRHVTTAGSVSEPTALPALAGLPSRIEADSGSTFVAVWSAGHEVQAQWFCIHDDATAVCGDVTCTGDSDAAGDDERIRASDAHATLAAAIGLSTCRPCRCDTDASGDVTVADAARILRASLGDDDAPLTCEPCPD